MKDYLNAIYIHKNYTDLFYCKRQPLIIIPYLIPTVYHILNTQYIHIASLLLPVQCPHLLRRISSPILIRFLKFIYHHTSTENDNTLYIRNHLRMSVRTEYKVNYYGKEQIMWNSLMKRVANKTATHARTHSNNARSRPGETNFYTARFLNFMR